MSSPPPQRSQIGNPANTLHPATDVDMQPFCVTHSSGVLRIEASNGGFMEVGEGPRPRQWTRVMSAGRRMVYIHTGYAPFYRECITDETA